MPCVGVQQHIDHRESCTKTAAQAVERGHIAEVIAVPRTTEHDERGASLEHFARDVAATERALRELRQRGAFGNGKHRSQVRRNLLQLRIVGLRLDEQFEQFAVGTVARMFRRGKNVEKHSNGCQPRGVRTDEGFGLAADVGFRTTVVAVTETLQELVFLAAGDFHLFQPIGLARQVHFLTGHRNKRERGVVGIDQSEEQRRLGGTIVAEGAARQMNAVGRAPVGGTFRRSVGDDRGLVHTFDLPRQASRVFVGAAREQQGRRKEEREE